MHVSEYSVHIYMCVYIRSKFKSGLQVPNSPAPFLATVGSFGLERLFSFL